MTRHSIGAVVRCGDLVAGVYRTVNCLLNGLAPADVVAIVADPSTPATAEPWLAAFAAARRLPFLRVKSTSPGASWNAGLVAVGTVDLAICVDSGESLDPSALDVMSRRMSSNQSTAVVTTGIEWMGPGTRHTFTEAPGCSPFDILADPMAVHVSSLFRWPLWKASAGFDETMPALEYTDLWLRLIGGGGAAVAERAPLLRRRVHARALYRRTWLTEDYRSAVQALFERHWKLVASMPGALLKRKDCTVSHEYLRHEGNRARLHAAEAEIERLRARRAEAIADVPADWKSVVDLGALARTTPLSHDWGYERGTPADRPIVEGYLAAHASDIRGTVLEVQENDYTRRFGGARVERSDVLDLDIANPRATMIGDLRGLDHVASATYDCIILTQTLHIIDEMPAVIRECHRLLKDDGVLLATAPCASRVCLEYGPDADYWRLTEAGVRRLFAEVFPVSAIETTGFGNSLLNAAFGFGLASEDLPPGAYESSDPYFPILIGIRAVKIAESGVAPSLPRRQSGSRGVVLMYHRVGASGIDPHRLSVSESTFSAQLEWLRTTCSVIPLEALAGGGSDRAIAITFDDGYVDNVSKAMPLLRSAGVPATFFLTTAEGPFPFYYWWDRLAALLMGAGTVPPSLSLDLPSGPRELPTASESERHAAHWHVYHEIIRLPPHRREAILDRITAWAAELDLDVRDRRMTWTEVSELTTDAHYTIGAHTVEHLFLPAQTDDVLMSELVDSRAALERVTGSTVETLAYPFGAVDERTVRAARAAGFRLAVTCADAGVRASDDRLALPRVEVIEEPLERFVARVERALGQAH